MRRRARHERGAARSWWPRLWRPAAMKAWVVRRPGPIDGGPLDLIDRDEPVPGPGELRVRVSTCGVCRTDLHLAEGDLLPRRPDIVPGHEVVGRVDGVGAGVSRFGIGDRLGVAWLRHACGRCRYCLRGDENLCLAPGFTGWDADGGYAEYAVVDENYAYALPNTFDDVHAAPLLCAGIIGYRALRRSALPPGGRLGIYGFGASAHLAAQVALHEGATVHVLTRAEEPQRQGLEPGAAPAGESGDVLGRTVLTIQQQAGDDGRLFGSVTTQDIADAIREARGLKIDRRKVHLDEPIKNVGTYMVEIEIADGVTTSIKTLVVEQK